MKKVLKTLFALSLILSLTFSLTACGGNGNSATAGKVIGVYLSPSKMSYRNMRPQYNYYLTTFAHQELTLMDDGTYCLILSASQFSALELDENSQDAKGNERENSLTKIYGTYTSVVNDLDDDLLDITLSAPTRIVKSYDQSYWLDTDNWSEDMGKNVIPPIIDPTTGESSLDLSAKPWTAEQYLESFTLAVTSIQVNQKTASFDFTDFGV